MRQQQQAAVARIAALARTEASVRQLLDSIAGEIAVALDVDLTEILEYDASAGTFQMVAGSGWPEGIVGRASKPDNLGSLAGYTLASKKAVIVSNFEDEERFDAPFLLSHGAVSGMSVPIGADDDPWGVLAVQTRRCAEFSRDDIHFLLAIATLLWSAIRRESIEYKLRDEQKRTHALLSNSAAFAWMKDTSGRYVYVSPTFETEFGVESSRWIGATDEDLFPEEVAEKLRRNDRAALEADRPLEFVETLPSSDGETSTFMVNKFAFDDSRGQRYIGGVAVDITARMEVEQSLERSRAELHHMIDSATIGIAFATLDGEVLQANDALLDIFSVSREDFESQGWDWSDTVLPLVERFADVIKRLGESASSEIIEIRRKDADNENVWVLASAKPMLTNENVYVAFLVDITLQKKAELALAASEQRFRLAARTAEFGTYYADLDQGYIVWSRETSRLMGYEKADSMTTPIGEVPKFIVERDRLRLAESIQQSLDPAGSGRLKVEFRVVRPSGAQRWLLMKGRTVFSDQQNGSRPLRMAGFVHDITQQKLLERKLRDARAAAESASVAKSQFLANMSHEIRTPMTSILGYAEILSKKLDGTNEKALVERIHENGVYLCDIIDDVLDLSKIEAGKIVAEQSECDVAAVIANVFYSMEARTKQKEIGFELRFGDPIPRFIVSDSTMIRQILLNIVGNGIKYTTEGSVTITVRCNRPAREIRFEVRDTGPGIEAFRLRKVFEPFEQGQAPDGGLTDGTGLGLSISKRLIEALGGGLEVESEPGAGSTFIFTLDTGPLDNSEWLDAASDVLAEYAEQDSTGSFPLPVLRGDILVVEDNEDIRYLVANAVETAGGAVTEAVTGREAVEIWRDRDAAATFDAILMDLRMPEMDGLEAARLLREEGYAGPVIALTAHAMQADRDKCLAAGFDDFLEKPIDRRMLLTKLRSYIVSDSSLLEKSAERHTRVLCVDDSVDTTAAQKMLLELRGYQVTTARNAAEATAAVDGIVPDVALIDLGLPRVDGAELLGRLQQRDDLCECRYICVSGRRESDVDWQGLGFDAYLQKPVQIDDLVSRIEEVVRA